MILETNKRTQVQSKLFFSKIIEDEVKNEQQLDNCLDESRRALVHEQRAISPWLLHGQIRPFKPPPSGLPVVRPTVFHVGTILYVAASTIFGQ